MGEVITNLKARFSVDSQNVSKGLKPGENALTDLNKKVEQSVKGFKNMFSPLLLGAGALGGAFATLKGAIDSVEGPGNKLESIMGGLKESFFEAGRALATMDFNNFFENLNEGFDRGVKFTEMLDELADRSAYNDYRINQLKRESAVLQEIVKNKTLEISVRTEAAKQVEDIEEKIKLRREELAREEFEIQKYYWEKKNKIAADEALKAYERIEALPEQTENELKRIFTIAENYKDKLAKSKFIRQQTFLFSDETVEAYKKYFALLQDGERDVLIKLFNTFKNIEETGYRAQEDYNSTVAQTTALLTQEEGALNRVSDALKKKKEAEDKALLAKLKKEGEIADPRYLQIRYDFTPTTDDLVKVKEQVVETTNEIGDIVNSTLGSALDGMAVWLGEFAVGMETGQGLLKIVGSSFGDMLINLGRVAIATGIGLAAIQKAFETMNPAVALVAGVALVALGSAIKASVSKVGQSVGAGGGGGSAGGGGDYTYDTRGSGKSFGMAELKITGEFVLQNNVLVAAIERESGRRRATT